MKKSIKIIILSILIILFLSINIFAYDSIEFTRENIKISEVILDTSREDHDIPSNTTFLEHYLEQDEESIKKMSRAEAKKAIETIRSEIQKIEAEISSHHPINGVYGSQGEAEEVEQLKEKVSYYNEKLKPYKKKIDTKDIYYYMDNLSNSSNLYRKIDDLSEEELKAGYEGITNCEKYGNIGTYTTSEVREKKSKYIDKYNIIRLNNAIQVAQGAQVSDLSKSPSLEYSVEELKDYKRVLKDQRNKYSEGSEGYKRYNSWMTLLDELIEFKINLMGYKAYIPSTPGNYDTVIKITGNVLAIVRNIGVIVAVISLSIIGIKYIFGSVEEKAEYKKTLVPFTIGLILFAAIIGLVSFVFSIVNGLF